MERSDVLCGGRYVSPFECEACIGRRVFCSVDWLRLIGRPCLHLSWASRKVKSSGDGLRTSFSGREAGIRLNCALT